MHLDDYRSADYFREYRALKKYFPEEVLLIRIGPNFETFAECAVALAKVARLRLTQHSTGVLAGIRASEVEKYRQKLLDAGYKVVLAEQVASGKFQVLNPNEKEERAELRKRRKLQRSAQRKLEFEPGSGG